MLIQRSSPKNGLLRIVVAKTATTVIIMSK
jgi:hypothetical protein